MSKSSEATSEVAGNAGVRIVDSISMSLAGDRAAMQQWSIKNMDKDGETKAAVLVNGIVTGFETKEFTRKDPKAGESAVRKSTVIKGRFEGINVITGEHHMSGMLYLNDNVVSFIEAEGSLHGLPMDIELAIEVMRWSKAGTGYKQSCRLISAKKHIVAS